MHRITPDNVIAYLRDRGILEPSVEADAELLGWGVSNVVLRVNCSNGHDLVVKQSREKLRTEAEWRSRLDRVFREAEVMQALADILPEGTVPGVLFEDRQNFLFGMQAVEADHTVWKAALLQGLADPRIAKSAADCLAAIHSQTVGDQVMKERWEDRTVFDELRLDPFYRFTASRHADAQTFLEDLIRETMQTRVCLVLGDFSPKNILLTLQGIALVDFETAHFGDPAFDVGFFLSHLLLKTVLHGNSQDAYLHLAEIFWRTYLDGLIRADDCEALSAESLARRAVKHLAACLLARIDGKSPVEYLGQPARGVVRRFAARLIADPPKSPEQVFALLKDELS